MPHVLDGLTVIVNAMSSDGKCEYKPEEEKWKANLDGSATRLGSKLGNKPHATSEAELSATSWPSQAHHLIPHLTLKGHAVAQWLKKGSRLYADTNYDVDHKNNGFWMPYASGLREWKQGARTAAQKARNRDLMFKVMRLANIQLHQGRHSGSQRYGIGVDSYKGRVSAYLKKIKNHSVSHYAGPMACKECSTGAKKGKYPPRANSVAYVDRASALIANDIRRCLIFVSQIASEFAQTVGFT